jgi:hypothetical protein
MPPSLEEYRWRLANIAIGPSTLRNQGASGVAEIARNFLAELDLSRFIRHGFFEQELNRQTVQLKKKFPEGAKNWGTARKAINLFLGEAYYHRCICRAYQINKIEQSLEVPLDRTVATFLFCEARRLNIKLPHWPGIKNLELAVSQPYQDFASYFARTAMQQWSRIHLDVIIWRGRADVKKAG